MKPKFQNWKDRLFHDAFLVTVVVKGLDGILGIIFGFVLIYTDSVSDIIFFLTRNEIVEDPDNYFATHLRAFAAQSHEAFLIGGLYLIAHGLVKSFISISLWRSFVWAYPAAMAILSFFILGQLIRISQTGSLPLIIITLFDVVMLALVLREYLHHPNRAV